MNSPMSSIIDPKEHKKYRGDRIFYQLGKFLWLPFCIAGVWFAQTGYEKYGALGQCSIRRRCGLPCPGCGGTRAFYYLFLGDFVKSLELNPSVIFGVLAYFHFMLLYFYGKRLKNNLEKREIHIEYYLYAAIGVILVQWIMKLIRIFSIYLTLRGGV